MKESFQLRQMFNIPQSPLYLHAYHAHLTCTPWSQTLIFSSLYHDLRHETLVDATCVIWLGHICILSGMCLGYVVKALNQSNASIAPGCWYSTFCMYIQIVDSWQVCKIRHDLFSSVSQWSYYCPNNGNNVVLNAQNCGILLHSCWVRIIPDRVVWYSLHSQQCPNIFPQKFALVSCWILASSYCILYARMFVVLGS